MADVALAPSPAPDAPRTRSADLIARSLSRRRRAEVRFRAYGLAAVIAAIAFVVFLFWTILQSGLPAFFQAAMTVEVTLDPAVIDVGPRPVRADFPNEAAFAAADLAWQTALAGKNFGSLIERAVNAVLATPASSRDIRAIYASNERFRLRDMVAADPGLIGRTIPFTLVASADVDVWFKGNIDRSLPENQQQLTLAQQQITDAMIADGTMKSVFASWIFTNVDSRSSPATAGLAGAFMGSLFMMLVVIALSVPIGVAGAIYLEEFAPKNRITDLIEVNINNLAAVPSIVFGLLGAAVFINAMHLPLSAPIVGGLVLSLMTLPTIIIATRGVLRAVPPSIREAATGLGASRVQVVFHHVLPLVIPGILTATIIGVAQALGETAPLLLVGMSAFVANIPTGLFDQSTALPVQLFLWQGNENRNFFEPRTSAAIIVLLGLMILLNALAIFLRQRFQTRW
ncbi:MAG: phosphate ABC transporter permease PstA [Bauldia sp.]|nr:phosphate ABC transporter permease PstA [Bauldia sp.]